MSESLVKNRSILNQAQLACYLFAACPTFQKIVGAVDELDARNHAHDIRILVEEFEDDIDGFDQPPYVLCSKNGAETSFDQIADGVFGGQGQVVCQFVTRWDPEIPKSLAHREHENVVGEIVAEALAISSERRDLLGYADRTHLHVTSMTQVASPYEIDYAERDMTHPTAGNAPVFFYDEWRLTHPT